MSLVDSVGRQVTQLRISLTDRCNFRCLYCMPPEGISFLPKSAHLSRDAIVRFARIACKNGVRHIRLTGGEPLLRPDIVSIVPALSAIPELDDLALTTNGARLAALAEPLKCAGLHRVNVSLDSMDPAHFQAITLSQAFPQVMDGIAAAIAAGLALKINVVVLKGMNDVEILSFAQFAFEHDVTVRFLEFMPLCGSAWRPELVYPVGKIRDLIASHFTLREEPRGHDAAQRFVLTDGVREGRIGLIGALSEPFCDSCARIRLSSDGKIRPCLFSNVEFNIKALLDRDAPDEDIAEAIQDAVWRKPRGSKYATDVSSVESSTSYLRVYEGEEHHNPLIHSIGG